MNVATFIVGTLIVLSGVFNYKNLFPRLTKVIPILVVIGFTLFCVIFGVRVSLSDHSKGHQIICFLMLMTYVSCLLIWKPFISVILNVSLFVGFHLLLKHFNAQAPKPFDDADEINYYTFLISLTMISVMIYHQRLNVAKRNEELERIAHYDEVTGLNNYAHFVEEVSQLVQANAHHIDRFIILYINIDGFRIYNDQRGFQRGNEFLKRVGELIVDAFRNFDVVCRSSGDRYVVFTTVNGYESRLTLLNERVRSLDKEIKPEIKVGGYVPTNYEDIRRMVDKARYASVISKESHEQIISIYDKNIHDNYHFMQYILRHVDDAINNDYIVPYYQPVVSPLTGKIISAEALARWIDPNKGMLPPYKFIPTLENAKMIRKVDIHMVEKICQNIRKELDEGRTVLPISLNLSRMDFEDASIVNIIDDLVNDYHLPRMAIHVEITESAIAEQDSHLKEAVKAFQRLGYEVWLDDFGSGYSSLNTLKDFHFDVVKLDMEFLKGFESNPQCKPLIESTVNLARKLNMDVLCEGVETKEQMEFLKSIGVNRLQGYLFDKAITHEELLRNIDNKKY